MRIFALETDTAKFRRKFIVKGEKELLCTHSHWILFVTSTIIPSVVMMIGISFLTFLSRVFPESIIINSLIVIGFLTYTMVIINNFIHWKYSFIFLTTEKVICVTFNSLFSHDINPTHLDNINSTEVKSEFGGIFRSGSLIINLHERNKYSTKRLVYKNIPNATNVAGAIENAIVLVKHRPDGRQGITKQQPQIRDIRSKIPNEVTLTGRASQTDSPPQSAPLPGENQRP